MTGLLLKVEGAGNDFVLGTGDWGDRLAADADLVTRLCHRRRGVGADGALALRVEGKDRVRLVYRNADGSLARFCGNGTRCAARAAVERLGLGRRLVVETDWVAIAAEVVGSTVSLELPPPAAPPREVALDVGGRRWSGSFLEVGVPHLVIAVEDLAAVDLDGLGPPLRRHSRLGPEGANVNFVETRGDGGLAVRTYERGVEGETPCCGSGVVAAGLVQMAARGGCRVVVRARSGDELVVETLGDPVTSPVRLVGPTRIVADLEPSEELLRS